MVYLYTYIWLIFMVNVGEYNIITYMDAMDFGLCKEKSHPK